MSYPKRMVFVRHAETEGNLLTRDGMATHQLPNHAFQLTLRGIEQSEITGNFLKSAYPEGFDVAFVSTFNRTVETYKHFGKGRHFPEPIIDSRLDEKFDGIRHSLSETTLNREFPSWKRTREKDGWYHHCPIGGRSGPMVELSIYVFLQELRELHSKKNCLMICHGNWLLLLQRIMENMTPEEANQARNTVKIPNCCVTTFERDKQGGLIKKLNRFVPWKGKIKETPGLAFA